MEKFQKTAKSKDDKMSKNDCVHIFRIMNPESVIRIRHPFQNNLSRFLNSSNYHEYLLFCFDMSFVRRLLHI